jgi:hypothetical protein
MYTVLRRKQPVPVDESGDDVPPASAVAQNDGRSVNPA